MLKRTKGRLLIALLVVTGLAGTIHSDTLTQKERKYALKEIKDSKNDVLKSVKGLSEIQMIFKSAPNQLSIKECIYDIVISENNIWQLLEGTMKAPANPEKIHEIKINDEQLVNMIKDQANNIETQDLFEIKSAPWKSLTEALDEFKIKRSDHIKYMKSTTEDLRNHVVRLPFGWIDCYQLYLMIGAISNRYMQQVNKIKTNPDFPKN